MAEIGVFGLDRIGIGPELGNGSGVIRDPRGSSFKVPLGVKVAPPLTGMVVGDTPPGCEFVCQELQVPGATGFATPATVPPAVGGVGGNGMGIGIG